MRSKKEKDKKFNTKALISWLLTVLVSLSIVLIGNGIVTDGLNILNMEGAYTVRAEVVEIGETESTSYTTDDFTEFNSSITYFNAKVLSGEFKGEVVTAAQTEDNYTLMNVEEKVSVGDKVILYNYGTKEGEADFVFGGYSRLDYIIVFGAIFFALLLFFGHTKGLNTIISLGLTVLAVFCVFVPSVLAGYNVYVMVALTCIYTIIMTLLITNGYTEKSFTTIMGCSFGVVIAAILEVIFSNLMKLTGVIDEHSIYLSYLDSGVVIDLKSLVFAMTVIGAMGAVMDVAMDISSSLHEIHVQAPHLSLKELYKSGITIGRDVMGTMANTLVLAYIGSSLCTILLMITYSSSLMELLNRESIIVELLQAMVGSTAILLTIPVSSLVCAILYTSEKKNGKVKAPVNQNEEVIILTPEKNRSSLNSKTPTNPYVKDTPNKRF